MLPHRSDGSSTLLDRRPARPGSRSAERSMAELATTTGPVPLTADRPDRGRLIATVAEAVGLVVVVVASALFQLTDRVDRALVANADNLLPAQLYEDLRAGGSLADWYLPYAPYLVPDWLLYAVVASATDIETVRLALFAVIQFGILVGAVAAVARSLTGRWQLGPTASVCGLLVLLGARGVKPAVFLAAPFIHFGTFALTLVLLALTLRYIEADASTEGAGGTAGGGGDEGSWEGGGDTASSGRLGLRPMGWLVLSAVVAAALVASDRIVVVWFHVPATVAMVAWATQDRRRRWPAAQRWIGVHLVTSLAALPAPGLLGARRSDYDLGVSLRDPMAGAQRLWQVTAAEAAAAGWWFWLPLLALPPALWALARGRAALDGRPLVEGPRIFLLAFLPTTVVTTLMAQVLLSGAVPPGPRYSFTVLTLPILVLAGLLTVRPPPPAVRAMAAVPVLVVGGWSAAAVGTIDLEGPDHIDCVRRQLQTSGSIHGVASYWDARDLVVYIDEPDVTVASHDLFGRRVPVNVTVRSYHQRYDFLVHSERHPLWILDLALIEAVNGPPRAEVVCGDYTVWDYGPDGFVMEPLATAGGSVTFDGCGLRTQVGVVDPDSCVVAADGAAGFVTYGPYLALGAGTYQAELRYRTSADDGEVVERDPAPVAAEAGDASPGPEVAGLWEVTELRDLSQPPVAVATEALTVTGGEIGSATLTWTLNQELAPAVVEVRTVADGSVGVEVWAVVLTRLD